MWLGSVTECEESECEDGGVADMIRGGWCVVLRALLVFMLSVFLCLLRCDIIFCFNGWVFEVLV